MPADVPTAVFPTPSRGARCVLAMIRSYQLLFSPLYSGSCRFVPSCSQYATEAIQRFGAMRGSVLAARRLMRCHPLGSHGFDPVPDSTSAPRRGKPART